MTHFMTEMDSPTKDGHKDGAPTKEYNRAIAGTKLQAAFTFLSLLFPASFLSTEQQKITFC